jgi:hypothetical protein
MKFRVALRLLLVTRPKRVTPLLQLMLTFKTPWREGTTHLAMSPPEHT